MKHDYTRHEHEHEHEHEHLTHEHHEHHECDGEGHVHHHHEDGSCCCEHHENIHHGINKFMIVRLAIAALLFFSHEFLHFHEEWFEIVLFGAVALIAGYDVIFAAVKNIFRLKFFDEYFLMTFAAIAAFIIGNYHEAAAVMFLYRAGETCQDCAIRYSRKKIASVTGRYAPIGEEKGSTERFITRFSRIYTPVILICALIIAVALPVFGDMSFKDAVYRALTFLVVACPCAIVISVPMAYFAGIASAAGRGVFFHDTTVVDKVAKGELDIDAEHGLASGLVIIGGDERFALAMSIAAKARNIAIENIVITIAVKLAVVVLGVFGVSSLWFAVFADSGITIILALNALRAFSVRGKF